jgi:hypothetical protein
MITSLRSLHCRMWRSFKPTSLVYSRILLYLNDDSVRIFDATFEYGDLASVDPKIRKGVLPLPRVGL